MLNKGDVVFLVGVFRQAPVSRHTVTRVTPKKAWLDDSKDPVNRETGIGKHNHYSRFILGTPELEAAFLDVLAARAKTEAAAKAKVELMRYVARVQTECGSALDESQVFQALEALKGILGPLEDPMG